MSLVRYAADRGLATVTLNRPERMRVVVLTGAGRAFCAGGDIGGFGAADPRHLVVEPQRPFDMNRRADDQTRHSLFPAMDKPVTADEARHIGLVHAVHPAAALAEATDG